MVRVINSTHLVAHNVPSSVRSSPLQGSMALARYFRLVLLSAALALLFFSPADAGVVGVSYGRVANNLPDPATVVRLLQRNGITAVRLYDANSTVLQALANTGIRVMVMLTNDELAAAALDPSNALRWARTNVAAHYPATRIRDLAVGNEVFLKASNLTRLLVPAMVNVQAALVRLRLDRFIKVSTPLAFTSLAVSWPPSAGRFRGDILPVMRPMLDFLERTGSYLSINPYPFFAYLADPANIPLDYALGNYKPGVRDPVTGLVYHSLLDAQIDATYFAMEKLGATTSAAQGTSMATGGNVRVLASETGNAYGGGLKPGKKNGRSLLAAGDDAVAKIASVASARAYNNYLINRILSGRTGTPHRPNADMDIYIFSLFNENQKGFGPGDIEQHFGLFYPNQTKVYGFDFRRVTGNPPSPPGLQPLAPSWCVANAAVGDARLQAALDYACSHGADCSVIRPGAKCFEPNTKAAHASHALNSYYQRSGRANGTCNFDGAATVVYHQAPKIGNCVLPSKF